MTRDEALSVLGLSRDAGRDDVVAAYRELAQMLHPDKYGDNKRLRKRAERQMSAINQARDVLIKGAASRAPSSSERTSSDSLRARARIRAQAAETARLSVVAQIRTLKELRSRAIWFAVIGLVGMLIASRVRSGAVRSLGFPICSTLAVWGLVDIVNSIGQIKTLSKRAKELLDDRDAARAVANGEV